MNIAMSSYGVQFAKAYRTEQIRPNTTPKTRHMKDTRGHQEICGPSAVRQFLKLLRVMSVLSAAWVKPLRL